MFVPGPVINPALGARSLRIPGANSTAKPVFNRVGGRVSGVVGSGISDCLSEKSDAYSLIDSQA